MFLKINPIKSWLYLLKKVGFCDNTPYSWITMQYLVFGAENNPYRIPEFP